MAHDVVYDVMFVLDSNILIAGLFSRRGASHWIVERAVSGRIPIAVSVALALEYEDVLSRSALQAQSWASSDQINAVLDGLLAAAKLVQPIRWRRRPLSPDPDDDLVLECALEAGAQAIVTMNLRDFTDVSKTYRIEVLRPGELVRRLRSEEPS